MRKIFRKAILSLCILSMGLVNVSCDSETITELITILITNLVGQQGTTYTFTGSGTAQELEMPHPASSTAPLALLSTIQLPT